MECNLYYYVWLNYGRGFQIATRRDIRERYGIGTESSDFYTPLLLPMVRPRSTSRESSIYNRKHGH